MISQISQECTSKLAILSLLVYTTSAAWQNEKKQPGGKHPDGTSFGDLLVKLEPYRYNSDRGYGIQNNFNEVRNFEDLQWMVCFKIDDKIYSPHEQRLTDNAGILQACRYWFPVDDSEEMIRKRILDECQLSPTSSDGSSMSCSISPVTMPTVPKIQLPEVDHRIQHGLNHAASRNLIQEIKQNEAETRGNATPSEVRTFYKRLKNRIPVQYSSKSNELVPVDPLIGDIPSPCSNEPESRSISPFTIPDDLSPVAIDHEDASNLPPPACLSELLEVGDKTPIGQAASAEYARDEIEPANDSSPVEHLSPTMNDSANREDDDSDSVSVKSISIGDGVALREHIQKRLREMEPGIGLA